MASLSNFFSSGGSNSQTNTRSYLPVQAEWLKKFFAEYGPQLGINENVWQGDRVAPFSDLQQNAIGGAANFLGTFTTPKTVGTPLFDETGQALSGILAGQTGAQKLTPEQVNQYFMQNIQNPTTKYLKETALPLTDEGYTGGNFWSTARAGARDKVIQDTADTLAQQKAGLEWNVLQSNQALDEARAGRTLSAIPQAMAYGQMPAQETMNNLQIAASQVQGLSELFGFGQAEQTQEQMELQAQIAKFAEENQITDPQNLQILLQLLGMGFSSTHSSATVRGEGIGYPAATQAVGLGMLGLAASDANIKENIKPIEIADPFKIIKSLQPYRYNYKGRPDRRIGFMAQDIEKVYPEAVIVVDGVKHVDLYAMQTLIIASLAKLID